MRNKAQKFKPSPTISQSPFLKPSHHTLNLLERMRRTAPLDLSVETLQPFDCISQIAKTFTVCRTCVQSNIVQFVLTLKTGGEHLPHCLSSAKMISVVYSETRVVRQLLTVWHEHSGPFKLLQQSTSPACTTSSQPSTLQYTSS